MIEILIFLFAGTYGIREVIDIKKAKSSAYSQYFLPLEKIIIGIISLSWSTLAIINFLLLWINDDSDFFSKPQLTGLILINLALFIVASILCYSVIIKYLDNSQESKQNNLILLDKLIKLKIPLGFLLLAYGIWKLLQYLF